MALNAKYRISLFFVFFLGLVSCSKDKDVVYQPLPVEAQNVGAMDSQQKMQWAKNITDLELGGELVIDLLRQQDFERNPIVVRVQSWCRTETAKGDLYNDVYFKNQFSIPVLNVLAPEALLSVSAQPLQCRFVMTLTDSTSSQAIYPFENITIQNSSTFRNLEAFTGDSNILFYEKIKQEILTPGDHYHLQCTDFQKMLAAQGETNWETLVSSNSMDFSSLPRNQQSCRLLIKRSQEVLLSAPFTLVFQPQELLILSDYHPLQPLHLELTPRKVLTLRMTNPNNYEIKLKMTKLQSSQFIFAPVYTGMGAIGHIGNERRFPIQWTLQSTPFLQSMTNEEWVLSLPAKQEITVEAHFSGKLHCDTEILARPKMTDSSFQGFPYFTGIHYGFDFQTQFLTHLSGDEWRQNNLLQGNLSSQSQGTRVFWDLFYEQVRARFGPFFKNPVKTNQEFTGVISPDAIYDRCKEI